MIFVSFQKLVKTLPNTQFEIEGYKVLSKDSSKDGGDIMIYINENIPCGEINSNILQNEIEAICWVFFTKKLEVAMFQITQTQSK